jgi:Flp pilus assembly pilin Flp
MKLTATALYRLSRLWEEILAQDLIEYALMAGFVATAAGAIMPGVATSISGIFSKLANVMADSSRTPTG